MIFTLNRYSIGLQGTHSKKLKVVKQIQRGVQTNMKKMLNNSLEHRIKW